MLMSFLVSYLFFILIVTYNNPMLNVENKDELINKVGSNYNNYSNHNNHNLPNTNLNFNFSNQTQTRFNFNNTSNYLSTTKNSMNHNNFNCFGFKNTNNPNHFTDICGLTRIIKEEEDNDKENQIFNSNLNYQYNSQSHSNNSNSNRTPKSNFYDTNNNNTSFTDLNEINFENPSTPSNLMSKKKSSSNIPLNLNRNSMNNINNKNNCNTISSNETFSLSPNKAKESSRDLENYNDNCFSMFSGVKNIAPKTLSDEIHTPSSTLSKILDRQNNYEESYINASYLDGGPLGRDKGMFIATQGPLRKTIQKFWKLVFQKSVTTIIMLCQEVEDMRVSLFRFYNLKKN